MAFTVGITKSVFGDKYVRIFNITADAAEANITTGFSFIDAIIAGRITSMATSTVQLLKNKNSTGTAANGTIGVSGLSSGAEFDLLVFGK